MLGKKSELEVNSTAEMSTVIGKGSVIEGTIAVPHSLRIDGKIKGKVTTGESLVVGKEGDVDGELKVKNAIIGGRVTGKVHASGKVVLESKSSFNGEMKTSKLVIDEGAIFEGRCNMGGQASVRGELPMGDISRQNDKEQKMEQKVGSKPLPQRRVQEAG